MQRPGGVTLIAVLAVVAAGFSGVAGLILSSVLIISGHNTASPGPIVAALLILVILAFATLYAAVGYGIWRLKNWARLATMVISALSIIGSLTQLLTANNPYQPGNPEFRVYFSLLAITISGWIVYYLTRAHVKQAFGATGF